MLLNKGQDAITPIALPDGIKSVRFFSNQAAQLAVDTRDGHPVTKLDLGNASAHVVTVPNAIHAFVAHRVDGGSNDYSSLSAPERTGRDPRRRGAVGRFVPLARCGHQWPRARCRFSPGDSRC